ncbi:MAG: hypothetical protein ACP5GX_07380, partial [Anaerolineae bacterium]
MSEEPEEILYCKWHPKVETSLRCYQCGTPICFKCAKRTPVGYICRDCQKARKQRFERSRATDYVIAGVVSLILGWLAGAILPRLGWFVVFLSPLAGTLIAEVVWRLIGRRYGSRLWLIVAGGIVAGTLPTLICPIFGVALGSPGYTSLLEIGLWLLWPVVH